MARDRLLQRADYTYQFNIHSGRHGWLRLTPAYSFKIVEEIINDCPAGVRILDPFCGTGTTALCAAQHGYCAVTTDINPFLVWLARAKTRQYAAQVIESARRACDKVVDLATTHNARPISPPPLSHIERWWDANAQSALCALLAAIEQATEKTSEVRDLLLVAFCRTLIALSNAGFNHQSVSFKATPQIPLPSLVDGVACFVSHADFVLESATETFTGSAQVMLADARRLSRFVQGTFDFVITSPHYANHMSYIRELRPYMYWLGFLEASRDAGELDWQTIGGTWGIATSRLLRWERPADHFSSSLLLEVIQSVSETGGKHGALLANYITRYFDDIWLHLRELPQLLKPGAEVHYIIGNSVFYGNLVPQSSYMLKCCLRWAFRRLKFDLSASETPNNSYWSLT